MSKQKQKSVALLCPPAAGAATDGALHLFLIKQIVRAVYCSPAQSPALSCDFCYNYMRKVFARIMVKNVVYTIGFFYLIERKKPEKKRKVIKARPFTTFMKSNWCFCERMYLPNFVFRMYYYCVILHFFEINREEVKYY